MSRFNEHTQWRLQANERAHIRAYENAIYAKLTSGHADSFAEELGTDSIGVKMLNDHWNRETEGTLKWCYVVINLDRSSYERDPDKYIDFLWRCLKKKYVGQYHASFELGDNMTHPHYNIVFKQTPKILWASKVIHEWSAVFQIAKNFVYCEKKDSTAVGDLLPYIQKEGIWYTSNTTKKDRRQTYEPTFPIDTEEHASWVD